MTLHEAIVQILQEEGKPLSTKGIADAINRTGIYSRKDGTPINKMQIRSRVKNYPKLFDYLNGQVVLTSDIYWRELLGTYWYLADTLRNYFSRSDLQFMLASLIFVKRIADLDYNSFDFQFRLPNLKVGDFLRLYDSEYPIEAIEDLNHLDNINRSPNVFTDYGQLLARLDSSKRRDLFKVLDQINTSHYSEEEFGAIFDYFLHLISAEFSNSTVPYTPKYLQDLMVALLDPEAGKNLYDPVCGSGGLLIESLKHTNGNLRVKGTEINHRMAQLGYMNLIMNGYYNVIISPNNCLDEIVIPEQYDYIIADLPINGFNNSLENRLLFEKWGLKSTNSGKGYSSPVLFVLSKLNPHGKAVITVSESLLFKGGKEREVRELMIANDFLESIISLPAGALKPYTSAKASIIILNKRKSLQLRNKVKLIEAHRTFSDAKTIEIDIEKIVESNESSKSSRDGSLRVIDYDNLKNDLNLSVATYSFESIEADEMLSSGTGRKLGELVDIRSGKSPKQKSIDTIFSDGIPVVKIENLSKDILDMHLDLESTNTQVDASVENGRSVLKTEGILIARIGENLKTTFYKPSVDNPKIFFHSSIFALVPRPKDDIIDLEYLYYQLNTEFVIKQIANNRAGAVMPHISISRLKDIVIPYVSKELQKQFTDTQKANIIAAERGKIEDRIKALGYEEEIVQKESDIVRTLVHELRPKLSKLNVFTEKLSRLAKIHNLDQLKEYSDEITENVDPELEPPENLSFKEIVNKLKSDSERLNEILTTVKDVMSFNLDKSDFVEVDLYEFVKQFITAKKVEINGAYDLELKGNHVQVMLHTDSMKLVLEQLLSNAEKHGFKDKSKKYKVEFKIRVNQISKTATIDYINNGDPFKLTQKDYINFITKSKDSSGSGIGGYYINRILKSHGGNMEIVEGLEEGFRMQIELPTNLN